MEFIKLEKDGAVATLTINRPQVYNALNRQVLGELSAALDDLERDPDVRVVIITGEGDRAFVAGADIAEMKPMTVAEARAFGMFGQRVFEKIERLSKPVIAAINGYALGGGCELALACDIRLASDRAKLGQPEVTFGITCGFGGTQRLARLVGPAWAKQLVFTGDMIDADTAARIGLVNEVVPHGELLSRAKEMADKIASRAPVAVSLSKTAVNVGLEAGLNAGLQLEAEVFGECFASQDQKEGMVAFLEKRKANFTGR